MLKISVASCEGQANKKVFKTICSIALLKGCPQGMIKKVKMATTVVQLKCCLVLFASHAELLWILVLWHFKIHSRRGRSVRGQDIFPACHFFAQNHPSPEAKTKQSSRILRENGMNGNLKKWGIFGNWTPLPVLLALIPLPFRSCIPSKEDERCTIVPCNGGPPHWIPGKGQLERTRNPAKKIHLGIGVVLRNT